MISAAMQVKLRRMIDHLDRLLDCNQIDATTYTKAMRDLDAWAERRERDDTAYPEMCREPDLCRGKGYCPRDPACNE